MYLVEFITDEGDFYHVAFSNLPSDKEILDYIDGHDWLGEEFDEDGLTWVVEKVTYIDNEKKKA